MEPYRLTPGHLRRIPSLSLLSEDQLAAFLHYVDVVSCKPGAKLFLESQAGDALYMILEDFKTAVKAFFLGVFGRSGTANERE